MAAVRMSSALRAFWRIHRRILKASRGRLVAQPKAELMIGGRTVPILAREVQDPERDIPYQRFIDDIDESYGEYRTRTNRRIPVVALEPV